MSKFKLNVGYTVVSVYQQNSQNQVSVVLYVDLKSSQIDLEIGQFDDTAAAIFKRTSLKNVVVALANARLITKDQYNSYWTKITAYESLSKKDKEKVDSPSTEIFAELADIVGNNSSNYVFTMELEDDMYETVHKEYTRKNGTKFKVVEIQPAVGNLIGSLTSKGVVPTK